MLVYPGLMGRQRGVPGPCYRRTPGDAGLPASATNKWLLEISAAAGGDVSVGVPAATLTFAAPVSTPRVTVAPPAASVTFSAPVAGPRVTVAPPAGQVSFSAPVATPRVAVTAPASSVTFTAGVASPALYVPAPPGDLALSAPPPGVSVSVEVPAAVLTLTAPPATGSVQLPPPTHGTSRGGARWAGPQRFSRDVSAPAAGFRLVALPGEPRVEQTKTVRRRRRRRPEPVREPQKRPDRREKATDIAVAVPCAAVRLSAPVPVGVVVDPPYEVVRRRDEEDLLVLLSVS